MLTEGRVVFDPKTEPHHHFIDEDDRRHPRRAVGRAQVCNIESLRGFDVHDYQVVMRGSAMARPAPLTGIPISFDPTSTRHQV